MINNKQLAYSKIDDQFKSFVTNNRELFQRHGGSGVIDVREVNKHGKLRAINMLEDPYNIAYVGIEPYKEGVLIAFMDDQFNKVYHYYDVD